MAKISEKTINGDPKRLLKVFKTFGKLVAFAHPATDVSQIVQSVVAEIELGGHEGVARVEPYQTSKRLNAGMSIFMLAMLVMQSRCDLREALGGPPRVEDPPLYLCTWRGWVAGRAGWWGGGCGWF